MKNSIISIFFIITVLALVALFFLFQEQSHFKKSELSTSIQQRIVKKEQDILQRIKRYYKLNFKAPIIISDKLPDKNFGMATFDTRTQEIVIYLNKNHFFESEDYMIDDVLPHEYAHALMFALGHFDKRNSGHTKAWQRACQNLGGIKCDRFVNHQDIVIDKIFK